MRTRSFPSLVLVSLFSATVCGEDAPARPDPLEILRRADAAIRNLSKVEYLAESQATGQASVFFVNMTGTVRISRGEKGSNPQYRIERNDPHRRQLIICDGKELMAVDAPTQHVALVPASEAPRSDTVSMLYLPEFGLAEPFRDELSKPDAQYLRREAVDGVECHVVQCRYDATSTAIWYFGVSDGLPRTVARIFRSDSGPSGFTLKLKQVKPDPGGAGDFFIDRPAAMRAALPVGWRAPEWALKSPEGKETKSADLRGSVAVLDFWAVWCGPCKLAMPGLQAIHEEFKAQPVRVIGINAREREGNDPAKYMNEQKFTYGLLLGGNSVADSFLVEGIPAIYVIGPDGRVLFAGYGPGHDAEIKAAIQAGLSQIRRPAKPARNQDAP